MKNKESQVMMGVALVIGILIGVIGSNLVGRSGGNAVPAPQAVAPVPPPGNFQQKIKTLQDVVAKDPGNRNAWVELGNNFFDSDQPIPAVEAYGKALEINDQDPNVLTDQGVMFRRLGWFDKAIENFEKANQIAPQHSQSLYNLGIVYRYDLQDFPRAIEVWDKFLALNPTGPSADQVRSEMQVLKSSRGQTEAKK